MRSQPKVTVLGSLNVDSTYRVPHLPAPGETITSLGATVGRGGKGANQALAAHRAGALVQMIGCVGNDESGQGYLEALKEEGIGTEGIQATQDVPTGSAIINVEDSGENTIVVDPGANHILTNEQVRASRKQIESAHVLLLQLECPLDRVRLASEMAREANVRIVMNPSPWIENFAQSGVVYDYLIVNETEAERFLGFPPHQLKTWNPDPPGLASLVVTRGSRSTLYAKPGEPIDEVPAMAVTPVDTVGAGDSFAGAIAVALAEGLSLPESIQFANTAGALATLKHGAQTAIPSREAIQQAMGVC